MSIPREHPYGHRLARGLSLGRDDQGFPDALEAAFRAHFNAAAARATPRIALLVLAVIGLFAALDPYALPSQYRDAWWLRAGLQGVPAIGLAVFSRTQIVTRHIQALMASSLMTGALGTMLIVARAPSDEWAHFLYPYALAQVAALAYTGSRLRFPYAAGVGAFLLCGYLITALAGQQILERSDGWVVFALQTFFLGAITLIGAGSCLGTERLLRQNFLQQRLLEQEHGRAESLLADMLPRPIVDRLKRQETVADSFSEVSVLFADLVGFTAFAARAPAARVVVLLDALFARFDALAVRHGVEKIKTIGDAYMAAGGVPIPRPDHAQAIARLALDMRDTVVALRALEPALDVRIGIATGPVIAGVIGTRRLVYDLWGDTVNVASRLESQGLPGQIQIDAQTRARLADGFSVVPRGTVTLKGRGAMETFWLRSACAREQ